MTTVERVARSDAWRRTFIQANGRRCRYCNRRASLDLGPDDRPWHIDHKTALARGGEDVEDNLALACKRCNLAKGVQPYGRFCEFARAAFWVPDDWRASEHDLDQLMEYYNDSTMPAYEDAPWLVDHINDQIVQLGDDGPDSPVVLLELHQFCKRQKRGNRMLFLVQEMHRLMPAMVAEIRMLRAELEAKEGELDAAAHLT